MSKDSAATIAEPEEQTVLRQKDRSKSRPKRQPRYNVLLWDDDHHTYAYVITMLQQIFGHPLEKGFQFAEQVDTQGRTIVLTTTREHAELKRDQIHAFGKDNLIKGCKGSMWSTIEALDG